MNNSPGIEPQTETNVETSEPMDKEGTEDILEKSQTSSELKEIRDIADEELGDDLEELKSLLERADNLGIELPEERQQIENIRERVEELREDIKEIEKQTKLIFFQNQKYFYDLNEKEKTQKLEILLESGIDLSKLKKEGISAGTVEKRLKDLLKTSAEEIEEEKKKRLFELYSKVSSPSEALDMAQEIEIDLDEETIEELKRAAVITEPKKIINKRVDVKTGKVVVEEFGGKYTLTEEQRKLMAEMVPYHISKNSDLYDYAMQESESEPPVLKDVELDFESFLDSLETSESLPFEDNPLEIIGRELKSDHLLDNFSSEYIPDDVGGIHFKLHSEVDVWGGKDEEPEQLADETINKWMEQKRARSPNREYPYGRDVPDLKRKHFSALFEELSEEWPEKGMELLKYYFSVADQVLERLQDTSDWSDKDWSEDEIKWVRHKVLSPFLGFIIDKETQSYKESFSEKVESQAIKKLAEIFPSIADELENRTGDYEVKLFSPATELAPEDNRGQYKASTRELQIKRGNTEVRTPTHELVHALSQGESEKAFFMDDEGERTSFADGLTEAVVDSCTELLVGDHTYNQEIQDLQQLRFWTFSSPYLREYDRPKAMEDKDLSLEFFVKALFDEKKSLEEALEEEGFDEEDRESFMEVARKLFADHKVKSF
ncbi:MAG: hypothetical protein ABEJ24_00595 [Candidatus Magasanikbacteria bacterium]